MCAPHRSSDLLPEAGRRSAHGMDAAIAVSASVVYPVNGDAGKHNQDANPEHRRNFEVEFLANGVKFAEAEHPPYQASYTPPRAGVLSALSAPLAYLNYYLNFSYVQSEISLHG